MNGLKVALDVCEKVYSALCESVVFYDTSISPTTSYHEPGVNNTNPLMLQKFRNCYLDLRYFCQ